MPPSKSDLGIIQTDITNEISRDAPEIARGVFGDSADHPDMARVSNQLLDQRYRQAYWNNERDFLQQEARRDPEQFLKVADRIGVQVPPPQPPVPSLPAVSTPPVPTVAPPAAVAPAPVPLPVPVPPPGPAAPAPFPIPVPAAGVPAAAPPVILFPNGQPLPPSGAM